MSSVPPALLHVFTTTREPTVSGTPSSSATSAYRPTARNVDPHAAPAGVKGATALVRPVRLPLKPEPVADAEAQEALALPVAVAVNDSAAATLLLVAVIVAVDEADETPLTVAGAAAVAEREAADVREAVRDAVALAVVLALAPELIVADVDGDGTGDAHDHATENVPDAIVAPYGATNSEMAPP